LVKLGFEKLSEEEERDESLTKLFATSCLDRFKLKPAQITCFTSYLGLILKYSNVIRILWINLVFELILEKLKNLVLSTLLLTWASAIQLATMYVWLRGDLRPETSISRK
jgi:hypothetical protein